MCSVGAYLHFSTSWLGTCSDFGASTRGNLVMDGAYPLNSRILIQWLTTNRQQLLNGGRREQRGVQFKAPALNWNCIRFINKGANLNCWGADLGQHQKSIILLELADVCGILFMDFYKGVFVSWIFTLSGVFNYSLLRIGTWNGLYHIRTWEFSIKCWK